MRISSYRSLKVVGLLASAALASSLACAGEKQAPSISPAELTERCEAGGAPVLIDVRSADEFAAGHIPGALNIPFDEVAERISEVEAPDGVALYCMIGPRARKGERALLESGYDSVLHLEGGLAAWQAAGYEVERAE